VSVLFWILAFLLAMIVCVFLLMLVCPCHYFFEGKKQDKFVGVITVRVGFLKICLKKEVFGNYPLEVYLGKWRFTKTKKQELRGERANKQNIEKRVIITWLRKLNRERVSLILELSRSIWRKMRPQEFCLKGRVGFADPYYTGLLAAALCGLPGNRIEIEPVFWGEICELFLKIKGQFTIGKIFYCLLYAYLANRLRVRYIAKRVRKKEENGYGL